MSLIKITGDIHNKVEVPVQIIALRFIPITRDIDNNILFQFAKYGTIDIIEDLNTYDKIKYVAMYLYSGGSDPRLELCLNRIAKIKNLKSIAFQNDYDDDCIYISEFAKSNSHIKVYFVSKPPNPLIIEQKATVIEDEPTVSNSARTPYIPDSYADGLSVITFERALIGLAKGSYREIIQGSSTNVIKGWIDFFNSPKIRKEVFPKIDKFLIEEIKEHEIYPKPIEVFNALIYTPLDKIKVVIIGQDPYHTKGAAHGLAFSHPKEYTKIQPSLANIYVELESEGYTVNKKCGDLTKWADQGVFLINTALTVRQGQPNSHKEIWKELIETLFKFISKSCEHLVVIMWGNHAQNYEGCFKNSKRCMLKSAHPSPMSVHNGFFGSRPFSQANSALKKWGLSPIDWNL